jgi:hypothetical protein
MSATSISPTNVDGPSHHWTFEEQFKQVYWYYKIGTTGGIT